MTNRIDSGGPAFPTPCVSIEHGMTLRDYFAGQVLANAAAYKSHMHPTRLATFAYRVADAAIRRSTMPSDESPV